jgi:hypothetical protein
MLLRLNLGTVGVSVNSTSEASVAVSRIVARGAVIHNLAKQGRFARS